MRTYIRVDVIWPTLRLAPCMSLQRASASRQYKENWRIQNLPPRGVGKMLHPSCMTLNCANFPQLCGHGLAGHPPHCPPGCWGLTADDPRGTRMETMDKLVTCLWGWSASPLLSNRHRGNRVGAHTSVRILRANYPDTDTVVGLKRRPWICYKI